MGGGGGRGRGGDIDALGMRLGRMDVGCVEEGLQLPSLPRFGGQRRGIRGDGLLPEASSASHPSEGQPPRLGTPFPDKEGVPGSGVRGRAVGRGKENEDIDRTAEGSGPRWGNPPKGATALRGSTGAVRLPPHKTGDQITPPLKFESRFESGNLRRAVRIYDREYDLILSEDTNDVDIHFQWFYFAVTNTVPGVPYRLNIVNLGKKDSLYNQGLRPLMASAPPLASPSPPPKPPRCYAEPTPRSETGRDTSTSTGPSGEGGQRMRWKWQRVGDAVCYFPSPYRWQRSPKARRRRRQTGALSSGGGSVWTSGTTSGGFYAFTFTLSFPPSTCGTFYLAYCYPYTYSDLQEYLSQLPRRVLSLPIMMHRTLLCTTLGGNRCDLLTITSLDEPVASVIDRPYVVITARVHPGESNSSFIMKGLLDFLLGSSELADNLRRSFVFKIVPMLNPDGVANGHHRTSLAGVDLNRCWQLPSRRRHPGVWHSKRLVERILRLGRRLLLFCDLHGHSRKPDCFMYGCEPLPGLSSEGDSERVRVLPFVLSKLCPPFSFPKCSFKVTKHKATTARVVLGRELGIPNSYTLECSMAGCAPRPPPPPEGLPPSADGRKNGASAGSGGAGGHHFTTADLEAFGNALCEAIADATVADEPLLLAEIAAATTKGPPPPPNISGPPAAPHPPAPHPPPPPIQEPTAP